jgi:hypothetical protein
MPCPREYGQVPTETDWSSHGARSPAALDDELAALRTQVARLRAENTRLFAAVGPDAAAGPPIRPRTDWDLRRSARPRTRQFPACGEAGVLRDFVQGPG